MVIHHTGGLHEGIANSGSHKGEASFAQIFAHRFSFWGRDGQLAECSGTFAVHECFSTRKAPNVAVKGAKFLLNGKKRTCVLYSRADFGPVPDDARIFE